MPSIIKDKKASAEQVSQVITDSIKHEILLYVGPPIRGLQRFSSFVGGYPVHFNEHLEQSPAFKKMFIQPEKLREFEQSLLDDFSVESMLYKKTKEYFSEVK
ncbi:hypothetical protein [Lysinibacillus fusiformis]|uniref:hypothetical protein n=1 Tax=Lysinibacillus fusiformis TaxID=28031 RepID=UPI0035C123FA|nr:hypothetical protein QYY55_23435 [Lysinibacillus fusiformis]